ncbi:MAG TPA: ABC transporter permease DevC [Pirellulales bacterium]|jgi:putative ABC transport system permease protein|nr:ABC transporter permease DevC [Pirellulales bacterium]
MSRTPLAWKNLTHEYRRLLLAVAGIGFAVLLMFMQLGFRGALLESTVLLPQAFNADLVIVSKTKFALVIRETFSRQTLFQARSCPGIDEVYPLYMELRESSWRLPRVMRHSLPVRTLAFNPRDPVLLDGDVLRARDELMIPDTVLFDRLSKADYGKPVVGETAYLADHRVRVVGTFALGTDFATDATVIMSDRAYAQFFFPPGAADSALSQIDIGLLTLEQKIKRDPAEVRRVQTRLREMLPENVRVLTKAEYIAAEQDFWNRSTPVGYVFGFGLVLGFVVGVIICYQVLYADVTDHMPEFATLKAMGYRTRFFVRLIMQESLYLSVLGFIPALVCSEAMYKTLEYVTGLPLNLSVGRALAVLWLAVAMCAVSGLLTLRRLLAADPAELFR